MMVIVTNFGIILYLVKNKKYDFGKASTLFDEVVDKNNKANNIKDLQDVADYFLKNSYSEIPILFKQIKGNYDSY